MKTDLKISVKNLSELIEKFPIMKDFLQKKSELFLKRLSDSYFKVRLKEPLIREIFVHEIKEPLIFEICPGPGQQEETIPAEILKILKNPDLFNEITITELDKKIVGEVDARKVIFLCSAGGRLIENSQIASYNLLVNDEAGAGKDYVVAKVLEIIPPENYIRKTRISPAVFSYWHNSTYEPEWTWNGKVFYTEDISESVLNSDVFKVMCSNGSSATILIKQKACEIEIIGKPVIITTTATATPNPELIRRSAILSLDSSEQQTKAVMKKHSEFKKKGIVPEYNPIYQKSMKYLKRVRVKIPFAELIDEHFPAKNLIMRTHYPRFLDFISASAGLHQYQREMDNEGFIIAGSRDYDIARDCFLKICSNKFMIPLTILQKQIMAIFEKNPSLKVSASQFHSSHNIMSLKSVIFNLGILAKYGILQSENSIDSYNRDLEVYSLSDVYNPKEELKIPTYAEICKDGLLTLHGLPQNDAILKENTQEENNGKVSKVSKVSKPSKVSKVSIEEETPILSDGLDPPTPVVLCVKCGSPDAFIVLNGKKYCTDCARQAGEYEKP